MQPCEFRHADRLPSDDVEKVTEASQSFTDVRFHYPSDCNRKYLRHHHVTVMRLHPAEDFFIWVQVSAYQTRVTEEYFDS